MYNRDAVMVLAASTILSVASANGQTIPELARANPKNPVVRGVLNELSPQTLDQMAKRAQLIVVARLDRVGTKLSDNQQYILTDYRIVPAQILSGQLPSQATVPGQAVDLILGMTGGSFTVDGIPVTMVNHAQKLPESGKQYLVFLDQFGTRAGSYKVHEGGVFEIKDGVLRSLAPKEVHPEIADRSFDALMLDLKRALVK
jgi:hypothetical protein